MERQSPTAVACYYFNLTKFHAVEEKVSKADGSVQLFYLFFVWFFFVSIFLIIRKLHWNEIN